MFVKLCVRKYVYNVGFIKTYFLKSLAKCLMFFLGNGTVLENYSPKTFFAAGLTSYKIGVISFW